MRRVFSIEVRAYYDDLLTIIYSTIYWCIYKDNLNIEYASIINI